MNKGKEILIDGVYVAYDYPSPTIKIEVYTTCNMHDESNVVELENILDESSLVDAVKIDEKDPPRRKENKFSGVLVSLVKESKSSRSIIIQSTSGKKQTFEALLTLKPKGRVGSEGKRDAGYSWLNITMRLEDNNIFNEIELLFRKLCVSTNAFYGFCLDASISTQRDIYLAKSAANILERKGRPDFGIELPDVYWLNYFGPGYVEFWGKDKIKRLEKAYNVTHDKNSGIVVQTTDEPMFADDAVDSISDYDFKQPMYEILGNNTFMHETHKPGDRGENVPTLEFHRSLV